MPPEKLRTPSRFGSPLFAVALTCVLASPGEARAQAAYTVLHTFTAAEGSSPRDGLIQAADGNFYGTTFAGGPTNQGSVFRMNTEGDLTVLHFFAGGATDGANPEAGLVEGADGLFYGTTSRGGSANLGTVFSMTAGGSVTILHAFVGGPGDGMLPRARLVQGADGRFYGTTVDGGGGCGTAFAITAGGVFTLLHSFTYVEGCYPRAPLIQAADGNFYGTTSAWGYFLFGGSVFAMTADGTVTVVYSFHGEHDGASPTSALVQGADGNLYGSSTSGFYHHHGWSGVVFRLHPGAITPLAMIDAKGLIQARNGDFYGTGYTDVFKVTPAGALTRLHRLDGSSEGGSPTGGLIQAADGSFYGTASDAGAGHGVVFRLTETPQASMPLDADFDGDGRADLAVHDPNNASWYIRYSSNGYSDAGAAAHPWGVPGDNPIVADVDGDGRHDLVVWRPTNGTWYVRFSSTGFDTTWEMPWGLAGDIPVAADFDGDGKTDLVVWRPSEGTWYVRHSSSDFATTWRMSWGLPGDLPVVADLDGDGRSDLVVWRPADGTWYVRFSSSSYATMASYRWGRRGDMPVAADFDGDGRSDLVVWRPSDGMWFVRSSSSNFDATWGTAWGLPGDVPIAADFDGDGKSDLVVWRPADGTWYVRYSSSNYSFADWTSFRWGLAADRPL